MEYLTTSIANTVQLVKLNGLWCNYVSGAFELASLKASAYNEF
jgi:hypothetical protein